jgi:hypothetical protein
LNEEEAKDMPVMLEAQITERLLNDRNQSYDRDLYKSDPFKDSVDEIMILNPSFDEEDNRNIEDILRHISVAKKH